MNAARGDGGMSGFTPGPWEVDRDHPDCVICTLANGAVVEIARTNVLQELSTDWEYANARLIAASWDLLELAQEAVRAKGLVPHWLFEMANAALDKVRGEQ